MSVPASGNLHAAKTFPAQGVSSMASPALPVQSMAGNSFHRSMKAALRNGSRDAAQSGAGKTVVDVGPPSPSSVDAVNGQIRPMPAMTSANLVGLEPADVVAPGPTPGPTSGPTTMPPPKKHPASSDQGQEPVAGDIMTDGPPMNLAAEVANPAAQFGDLPSLMVGPETGRTTSALAADRAVFNNGDRPGSGRQASALAAMGETGAVTVEPAGSAPSSGALLDPLPAASSADQHDELPASGASNGGGGKIWSAASPTAPQAVINVDRGNPLPEQTGQQTTPKPTSNSAGPGASIGRPAPPSDGRDANFKSGNAAVASTVASGAVGIPQRRPFTPHATDGSAAVTVIPSDRSETKPPSTIGAADLGPPVPDRDQPAPASSAPSGSSGTSPVAASRMRPGSRGPSGGAATEAAAAPASPWLEKASANVAESGTEPNGTGAGAGGPAMPVNRLTPAASRVAGGKNGVVDVATGVAVAGADDSRSPTQQITAALKAAGDAASVRIRLDPATLGSIQLEITPAPDATSNGQGSNVHILVSEPATLRLLERDMPALQRTLDQAGVPGEAARISLRLDPLFAGVTHQQAAGDAAVAAVVGASGADEAGRHRQTSLPSSPQDSAGQPRSGHESSGRSYGDGRHAGGQAPGGDLSGRTSGGSQQRRKLPGRAASAGPRGVTMTPTEVDITA